MITRSFSVRACTAAVLALMSAAAAMGQIAPPPDNQSQLEKQKLSPTDWMRLFVDEVYHQHRYNGQNPTAPSDIIYGADDRLDMYQVTDSLHLQLGSATCVVVNESEIVNRGDGTYQLNASRWTSQGGTLCTDEPFRNQYQIGFCSGFLVGTDIITTAGHCVSGSSVGSVAFIFGFDQKAAGTGAGADPDLIIPASNVYFGTAVIDQKLTGDLDYCVLRVDRPVTGRTPMQVRRTGVPALNDPLVMIGHPVVLPKKVDAGAIVKDPNGSVAFFMANTDSYGGNSGSPVCNRLTGVVEGILVRGNSDFVTAGGCVRSRVCPDSGCPTWEEISKATSFQSFIPPLGILVNPATDTLSLGVVGGPFTNPSVTYTLNNATSNPANYDVSIVAGGSAPVLIDGGTATISGSLPAGGSANFTVTYSASASSLAAGTYASTIRVRDLTNSLTYNRTHTLEVGTTGFDVTPSDGLVASGPTGGPFTQTRTYTVTSSRPTAVDVRITASEPWLTIDGSTGPAMISLPALGSSATFTVGIDGSAASSLPAALYIGSVAIDNLSGGAGSTTRAASLEIGRYGYTSTDTPKPLPDQATVTSTITIPDSYCIGDLDVTVNITHTYRGDLEVDLISPTGVTVRLHNRTGAGADDLILTYDDSGQPPDGPGMLADFNGKIATGPWTLRIADRASGDSGTLNGWGLKILPSSSPCPPVAFDVTAAVPPTLTTAIQLDGDSVSGGTLSYVIASLPTHGILIAPGLGTLGGTPTTLDSGGDTVWYRPDPLYVGADSFTYRVDDGVASGIATVSITVGQEIIAYEFNMDVNPGWSTQGQWAWGTPTGGGSHDLDPSSGFTGTSVYGYNLAGDYPNSLGSTQYLTTNPLDLTGYVNTRLEFRRRLGVESATYDHANIQASNNGTTWATVWDHTSTSAISEASWSLQSYSIAATADDQAAVRIRWGMGATDTSVTYPGWNLDDIRITGVARPSTACYADLNSDGLVDFADYLEFLNLYDAGDLSVDFNADGLVDFGDYLEFLNLYDAGC
ncbi:MAG: proprotein convertase P-domain-containing protein [Phycisphaerales bacterium]|nr:proprotein convertase P-domain-containing protein [Phycisphaerales bacterium]